MKDISFEYRWGKLAKGPSRASGDNMEILYRKWNGNPYFLYNYGAVLNSTKRYGESNEVFSECMLHLNDYDVQMFIADNYMNTELRDNAARHYTLAHNMIPVRFIPLKKLMELYRAQGDRQKALEVARQIVDKKIKVPSAAVSGIIKDAHKVIDEASKE